MEQVSGAGPVDELRTIFESLPGVIPRWIQWVAFGGDLPRADVAQMRAMAAQLRVEGQNLDEHVASTESVLAQQDSVGEFGDGVRGSLRQLHAGGGKLLEQAAALADQADAAANEAEKTLCVMLAFGVELGYRVIRILSAAAASGPAGQLAAVPAVEATLADGRVHVEALRAALKQAYQRIAAQTAARVPSVTASQFAVTAVRAAALPAGVDAGVQGAQVWAGYRDLAVMGADGSNPTGIDPMAIGVAAAAGAAGAAGGMAAARFGPSVFPAMQSSPILAGLVHGTTGAVFGLGAATLITGWPQHVDQMVAPLLNGGFAGAVHAPAGAASHASTGSRGVDGSGDFIPPETVPERAGAPRPSIEISQGARQAWESARTAWGPDADPASADTPAPGGAPDAGRAAGGNGTTDGPAAVNGDPAPAGGGVQAPEAGTVGVGADSGEVAVAAPAASGSPAPDGMPVSEEATAAGAQSGAEKPGSAADFAPIAAGGSDGATDGAAPGRVEPAGGQDPPPDVVLPDARSRDTGSGMAPASSGSETSFPTGEPGDGSPVLGDSSADPVAESGATEGSGRWPSTVDTLDRTGIHDTPSGTGGVPETSAAAGEYATAAAGVGGPDPVQDPTVPGDGSDTLTPAGEHGSVSDVDDPAMGRDFTGRATGADQGRDASAVSRQPSRGDDRPSSDQPARTTERDGAGASGPAATRDRSVSVDASAGGYRPPRVDPANLGGRGETVSAAGEHERPADAGQRDGASADAADGDPRSTGEDVSEDRSAGPGESGQRASEGEVSPSSRPGADPSARPDPGALAHEVLADFHARSSEGVPEHWRLSNLPDEALQAGLFHPNERDSLVATMEIIRRQTVSEDVPGGMVLREPQLEGLFRMEHQPVQMLPGQGKTLMFMAYTMRQAVGAYAGHPGAGDGSVLLVTTTDGLAYREFVEYRRVMQPYGIDVLRADQQTGFGDIRPGSPAIVVATGETVGHLSNAGHTPPRSVVIDEMDGIVDRGLQTFVRSERAAEEASEATREEVFAADTFLQDALASEKLSYEDFGLKRLTETYDVQRPSGTFETEVHHWHEGQATLTPEGRARVAEMPGGDRWLQGMGLSRLEMAASAEFTTHNQTHYVISNGKIVIIGQTEHGLQYNPKTSSETRWSAEDGKASLAQAVEAKELRLAEKNGHSPDEHRIAVRADAGADAKTTAAEIYRIGGDFFDRVTGASGTLSDLGDVLNTVYGLDTPHEVAPYNPSKLIQGAPDVHANTHAKLTAIAEYAHEVRENTGRFQLVLCDRNDLVDKQVTAMSKAGIPREAIEAVDADRIAGWDRDWLAGTADVDSETQLQNIFDAAGDRGKILVINRQGQRGVDISVSDDVLARGGMHVWLTEVPEQSYIYDQATNRTARNGQPGTAQALMSPQDALVRDALHLRGVREAVVTYEQAVKAVDVDDTPQTRSAVTQARDGLTDLVSGLQHRAHVRSTAEFLHHNTEMSKEAAELHARHHNPGSVGQRDNPADRNARLAGLLGISTSQISTRQLADVVGDNALDTDDTGVSDTRTDRDTGTRSNPSHAEPTDTRSDPARDAGVAANRSEPAHDADADGSRPGRFHDTESGGADTTVTHSPPAGVSPAAAEALRQQVDATAPGQAARYALLTDEQALDHLLPRRDRLAAELGVDTEKIEGAEGLRHVGAAADAARHEFFEALNAAAAERRAGADRTHEDASPALSEITTGTARERLGEAIVRNLSAAAANNRFDIETGPTAASTAADAAVTAAASHYLATAALLDLITEIHRSSPNSCVNNGVTAMRVLCPQNADNFTMPPGGPPLRGHDWNTVATSFCNRLPTAHRSLDEAKAALERRPGGAQVFIYKWKNNAGKVTTDPDAPQENSADTNNHRDTEKEDVTDADNHLVLIVNVSNDPDRPKLVVLDLSASRSGDYDDDISPKDLRDRSTLLAKAVPFDDWQRQQRKFIERVPESERLFHTIDFDISGKPLRAGGPRGEPAAERTADRVEVPDELVREIEGRPERPTDDDENHNSPPRIDLSGINSTRPPDISDPNRRPESAIVGSRPHNMDENPVAGEGSTGPLDNGRVGSRPDSRDGVDPGPIPDQVHASRSEFAGWAGRLSDDMLRDMLAEQLAETSDQITAVHSGRPPALDAAIAAARVLTALVAEQWQRLIDSGAPLSAAAVRIVADAAGRVFELCAALPVEGGLPPAFAGDSEDPLDLLARFPGQLERAAEPDPVDTVAAADWARLADGHLVARRGGDWDPELIRSLRLLPSEAAEFAGALTDSDQVFGEAAHRYLPDAFRAALYFLTRTRDTGQAIDRLRRVDHAVAAAADRLDSSRSTTEAALSLYQLRIDLHEAMATAADAIEAEMRSGTLRALEQNPLMPRMIARVVEDLGVLAREGATTPRALRSSYAANPITFEAPFTDTDYRDVLRSDFRPQVFGVHDGQFVTPKETSLEPLSTGPNGISFVVDRWGRLIGESEHADIIHVMSAMGDQVVGWGVLFTDPDGTPHGIYPYALGGIADPRCTAQLRDVLTRGGLDLSAVDFDNETQSRLWQSDVPPVADLFAVDLLGFHRSSVESIFSMYGDSFWVRPDLERTVLTAEEIRVPLTLGVVRRDPGHLEVVAYREGDRTIVQYRDLDPGSEPEQVATVFDTFHQRMTRWVGESDNVGWHPDTDRVIHTFGRHLDSSATGPPANGRVGSRPSESENESAAGSTNSAAGGIEDPGSPAGTSPAPSERRAELVPRPPDRITIDAARRDLDRELRKRFGDRELTAIEREDLSMQRWSRVQLYAHVDENIDRLAVAVGMPSGQLREHMRAELRAALADKPVAIRIDSDSLTSMLDDGVYRPTRTPDEERAWFEQMWFGHAPTYGYVAVDGIRPAGAAGLDVLSAEYGLEQVILKPEARRDTTFTVGDFEVHKTRTIASPLTDPLEWSFGAASDSEHDNHGLVGVDRHYERQPFRGSIYVEAQIHRTVTVDDIEAIVLHDEPPPPLREALDGRGLAWRVLNNSTIAVHGEAAERATALTRVDDDLARLRTLHGYRSRDPEVRQQHAERERQLRIESAQLQRSLSPDAGASVPPVDHRTGGPASDSDASHGWQVVVKPGELEWDPSAVADALTTRMPGPDYPGMSRDIAEAATRLVRHVRPLAGADAALVVTSAPDAAGRSGLTVGLDYLRTDPVDSLPGVTVSDLREALSDVDCRVDDVVSDSAPGGRVRHHLRLDFTRQRILVFCGRWGIGRNGMETVNVELCRGLASAGHEVTVRVAEVDPDLPAPPGLTVIGPKGPESTPLRDRLLSDPAELPESVDQVIVHDETVNVEAGLAALQKYPEAKLGRLMHLQPMLWRTLGDKVEKGRAEVAVDVFLARRTALMTGLGPVLGAEAFATATMAGHGSVHEMQPGFRIREQPRVPSPDDPVRVMLFGRLNDVRKGGSDAAEMVRRWRARGRSVQLVAVGAPDEPAEFERIRAGLVEQVGGDPSAIEVKPRTSDRETLQEYVRGATVVVMPTRAEGLGLVAVEAIEQGIPVLVTSSSGIGRFLAGIAEYADDAEHFNLVSHSLGAEVMVEDWENTLGSVIDDVPGAWAAARRLQEHCRLLTWERTTKALSHALINADPAPRRPARSSRTRVTVEAGRVVSQGEATDYERILDVVDAMETDSGVFRAMLDGAFIDFAFEDPLAAPTGRAADTGYAQGTETPDGTEPTGSVPESGRDGNFGPSGLIGRRPPEDGHPDAPERGTQQATPGPEQGEALLDWGSRAAPLVGLADVSTPLDDRFVADWLTEHDEQIREWRRHIFHNPRASGNEYDTARFVFDVLREAGLDPELVVDGRGVICDFGPEDGERIALRGDMDALKLDVDGEEKVLHACGHDSHTAMVLAAGQALASNSARLEELDVRVRLVFQPAEETAEGAKEMVEAGLLDGTTQAFALHTDPRLKAGEFGVVVGPMNASADKQTVEFGGRPTAQTETNVPGDEFAVDFQGPGGHTAHPEETVDLIRAMSEFTATLQTLLTGHVGPDGKVETAFGKLRAGEKMNVVPDYGRVEGVIHRATIKYPVVHKFLEQRLRELKERFDGLTYALDYEPSAGTEGRLEPSGRTVDVIRAMTEFVHDLDERITERFGRDGTTVTVFGKVDAEYDYDANTGAGIVSGTIRRAGVEKRDVEDFIKRRLAELEKKFPGLKTTPQHDEIVPTVINDPRSIILFLKGIASLGPDAAVAISMSMGGDDFAEILNHVTRHGAYVNVGIWSGEGEKFSLHQPPLGLDVDALDERALSYGARALAGAVLAAGSARRPEDTHSDRIGSTPTESSSPVGPGFQELVLAGRASGAGERALVEAAPGVRVESVTFRNGTRVFAEMYDDPVAALEQTLRREVAARMGAPVGRTVLIPEDDIVYREVVPGRPGDSLPTPDRAMLGSRSARLLGLFDAVTGTNRAGHEWSVGPDNEVHGGRAASAVDGPAGVFAEMFVQRADGRPVWQDHVMTRPELAAMREGVATLQSWIRNLPVPDEHKMALLHRHAGYMDALAEIEQHAVQSPDEVRSRAGVDAEAQVKARLVEEFLLDQPHISVVGFDHPDVPASVVEEIVGALGEMFARFPDRTNIRGLWIDYLGAVSASAASFAQRDSASTFRTVGIQFGLSHASRPARTVELGIEMRERGFNPVGDRPFRHDVVHEFVHAIDAVELLSPALPRVLDETWSRLHELGLIRESKQVWLERLPTYAFTSTAKDQLREYEALAVGFAETDLHGVPIGTPQWAIHEYVTTGRSPHIAADLGVTLPPIEAPGRPETEGGDGPVDRIGSRPDDSRAGDRNGPAAAGGLIGARPEDPAGSGLPDGSPHEVVQPGREGPARTDRQGDPDTGARTATDPEPSTAQPGWRVWRLRHEVAMARELYHRPESRRAAVAMLDRLRAVLTALHPEATAEQIDAAFYAPENTDAGGMVLRSVPLDELRAEGNLRELMAAVYNAMLRSGELPENRATTTLDDGVAALLNRVGWQEEAADLGLDVEALGQVREWIVDRNPQGEIEKRDLRDVRNTVRYREDRTIADERTRSSADERQRDMREQVRRGLTVQDWAVLGMPLSLRELEAIPGPLVKLRKSRLDPHRVLPRGVRGRVDADALERRLQGVDTILKREDAVRFILPLYEYEEDGRRRRDRAGNAVVSDLLVYRDGGEVEPEAALALDPDRFAVPLPWGPGVSRVDLDRDGAWFGERAIEEGFPLLAGISGTAARFAARFSWLRPSVSETDFAGAILGFLSPQHHSLYEQVRGMQMSGLHLVDEDVLRAPGRSAAGLYRAVFDRLDIPAPNGSARVASISAPTTSTRIGSSPDRDSHAEGVAAETAAGISALGGTRPADIKHPRGVVRAALRDPVQLSRVAAWVGDLPEQQRAGVLEWLEEHEGVVLTGITASANQTEASANSTTVGLGKLAHLLVHEFPGLEVFGRDSSSRGVLESMLGIHPEWEPRIEEVLESFHVDGTLSAQFENFEKVVLEGYSASEWAARKNRARQVVARSVQAASDKVLRSLSGETPTEREQAARARRPRLYYEYFDPDGSRTGHGDPATAEALKIVEEVRRTHREQLSFAIRRIGDPTERSAALLGLLRSKSPRRIAKEIGTDESEARATLEATARALARRLRPSIAGREGVATGRIDRAAVERPRGNGSDLVGSHPEWESDKAAEVGRPQFRVESTETVYSGPTFDMLQCHVRMPDGRVLPRDVIDVPATVAVVPVDRQGRALLISRFRPAVGGAVLELPTGLLPADADPMQTARRTLAASGLHAGGAWSLATDMVRSGGLSNAVTRVLVAREVEGIDDAQPTPPTLLRMPLEEAIAQIVGGGTVDSAAAVGVLAAAAETFGDIALRPATDPPQRPLRAARGAPPPDVAREYGAQPLIPRAETPMYRSPVNEVRRVQLEGPDGGVVEQDMVARRSAVMVLSWDERTDEVVLVRQYRPALDRWVLQLPAGMLDKPGEEPLAGVRRELAEEAGIVAQEWDELVNETPLPWISSERRRIYLARNLSAVDRPDSGESDEIGMRQVRMPAPQALDLALRGEIDNGAAVFGLLSLVAVKKGWLRPRPVGATSASERYDRSTEPGSRADGDTTGGGSRIGSRPDDDERSAAQDRAAGTHRGQSSHQQPAPPSAERGATEEPSRNAPSGKRSTPWSARPRPDSDSARAVGP